MALLYGFLVLHVASALMSVAFTRAVVEILKLASGVFLLWGLFRSFPRDRALFERVTGIVVWSSAAMVALLLYRYVVVFQSAYLGASFVSGTKADKNVLTWYLVFVLPFAFFRVRGAASWRRRAIALLPLLVLVTGWVYAASRAAWLSVVIGILAALALAGRGRAVRASFSLAAVFVIGAFLVFGAYSVLSSYVAPEAGRRLVSIYDPSAVPELRSYEDRGGRVAVSLEMFSESPIFGVGLGNWGARSGSGDFSHNDYVGILAELGIVGFLLFGGILQRCWVYVISARRPGVSIANGWVFVATRAAFIGVLASLVTINAYTTSLLWVFIGLGMVAHDIEAKEWPAGSDWHARSRIDPRGKGPVVPN